MSEEKNKRAILLMQLERHCHAQMNGTVVCLVRSVSSQTIQMDQHVSELKQPVSA